MFTVFRKELDWAGKKLTIETGKMARQADGAVLVTYGNTTVLGTAVAARKAVPGQHFFPLSVHYVEKTYSAGRIPGGFFKREGRPSEKEVLTSRLIDRPIRPLFPEAFKNETQVICTVLSYDKDSDAAIASMIAASAALTISGIPFMGPIAAARVGYKDGHYILNPTPSELLTSDLDLVAAGTSEGVLMVESEANELSEDIMLGGVMFAHKAFQPVIDLICDLAEECAKDPWEIEPTPTWLENLKKEVASFSKSDLEDAYNTRVKQDRQKKLQDLKTKVQEHFADREDIPPHAATDILHDLEASHVRQMILKTKSRIDGRDLTTVRPIVCEVDVLPLTHGSALFTRGETQALVVTTLGTGEDAQLIDALEGEYKEDFLLHYNFPSFSVGEVGRMASPGRREVGHGKLAWRAIHPLLPKRDHFPYTIRTVSEVLESNGSSSMATVCGTSLSLMDLGVPLKSHVAGIAMGLIKEGNEFAVLTDILGDEDHLGDMDFKVAGTATGVTALQMDIKITSINESIMRQALAQAKDGRLHIIGEMNKAIKAPRAELSANAPQMLQMKINPDKIREVIGSGGKVIREICEMSGAKIDIEDDGRIFIAGPDGASILEAQRRINNIVAEPELGHTYEGTVAKVVEFGAFVNFLGTFGLVHISEMAEERVEKSSDVVNVGDKIKVKIIGYDDRGKIKLSMKQAV